MARLKHIAHSLLGPVEARGLLVRLSVLAGVFLWGTTVVAAGLPPADPHINAWEWNEHAPPVGWFIVDFVIFVFLLAKIGKKPLQATFAGRHATIKHSISVAAERLGEAKATRQTYQSKLASVDVETSEMLSRSREDGGAARERLIEEAKEYTNKMRSDSTRLMGQEALMAQARLQSDTVNRALQKAEQLLVGEMNAADHYRLIEDAINELELRSANGGAR